MNMTSTSNLRHKEETAPPATSIRSAIISPAGILELLSQQEVKRLRELGQGSVHELFRQCALAVLNCEGVTDNAEEVFAEFSDFNIEIQQRTRGIKLKLSNAPACAFVDGRILNGVRDHLFAVLRDIVFVASELELAVETDASHLAEGRL
ncbi:MAG: pyrimidine/purine nucleosidase domain-containing protein, partial [Pseudomonadales bacterium]|nr:pyrimidine/purine nucleosidase domain-containing protein [Pseudomonadales bacterium]